MNIDKPSRKSALFAITGAFQLAGGIAAANRLAISALQDDGFQLRIFTLNESIKTKFSTETEDGVIQYKSYAGKKLWFSFDVWRALLTWQPQFVFCDHVNLASLLAPLAAVHLVKYHVRLNGVEVFAPRPDFEGRIGLKLATVRLAISEYTQRRVLEQFPQLAVTVCDLSLPPSANVMNSSRGSPPPLRLNAVDTVNRQLGEQVILNVGRMASSEQYKGQDKLIQSMPQVIAQFPNAQLVLVGEGDDWKRLQNLACELPTVVQSAIFMPGYVSDEILQALYSMSFMFAMPSRGEGFGLVYIEAMRYGKPCIGSTVDAASSVIQDGITGRLVPDPDDIQTLVQVITSLLSTPQIAVKMGEAGRERVKRHYLHANFKSRFLQTIKI